MTRSEGTVEELGDHRDEPVGAIDKGHVGGAGEYGELGAGQAGEIAWDAAAEQAK